jgi:lysophospholipase L1-like esterase
MKILFQGDSVTDAGRDRSNPHDLGEGYPHYASAMLQDAFPDIQFEFVNRGISGDRTEQLVLRLQPDFVDVQPDIVSIMIGINDVWHHYSHGIETTDASFEENLRTVLEAVRTKTKAKILLIQPFLLDSGEDKRILHAELERKQAIIKKLADQYADAYLPMDQVFHDGMVEEPSYYSADGVHPTSDGAFYIGEAYLGAITPLIEALAGAEED